MNYYEHHLRDYDAATAHLSWDEDLAYTRLIRWYYRKERPIPADVKEACRQVRAVSKPQRDAVHAVLQEFFQLREDGWHKDTCDEAIAKYQAGEPEREAKKKNEDTRLERHREERRALFLVINGAGVHRPWNAPIADLRELAKKLKGEGPATPEAPDSNAPATLPATGTATPATATQTPDTNHQTPVLEIQDPDGSVASVTADPPAVTTPAVLPPCPFDRIVQAYHELLPELPRVRLLGDDRREAVRKLWRFAFTVPKLSDGLPRATNADEAMAWIRGYFERARDNDFLMGRTPRVNGHQGWECDLDFLLSKKGLKQVIEKTREQQH